MKKNLIDRFLELKNTTFEKCTSRQKQILKTEKHYMWKNYTWYL